MHLLDAEAFIPARSPQPLSDDEIHLWFIAGFASSSRAGAGTAASRSDEVLRRVISDYQRCAPSALHLERGTHGKPFLVDGSLQFNLSHSGSAAVLAISRQQPLGVDIEVAGRQRRVLALATRFFHPSETQALMALPEIYRDRAFLELWSCKEAVFKAIGQGLSFGLHRLAFDLNPDGSAQALSHIDAELGASGEWQILRISPMPGCTGALAWRGPARRVIAFSSTLA